MRLQPYLAKMIVAGSALLASSASFAELGRANNFLLLDQHGRAHQLHYHQSASAIVLMAHSNNIPESSVAAFSALQEQFQSNDVAFYLIDANINDRSELLKDKNLSSFSVLHDETQLVSQELQLSRTGEVIVVTPKKWNIVYRGTTNQSLSKTLNAIVNGNDVATINEPLDSQLPAIQYNNTEAVASYSDTIAPMLLENCADCHRPEGIGPWAMTSYDMIKGFAPMIKETVLTQRMPPWHADPHVNTFKGDLSLSVKEKQQLVNWINAGAPRGAGTDPLTTVAAPNGDWLLGEPDLIVEFPSFEIPATGVLDYQFFEIPIDLKDDVWVKAVQTLPGDRAVVHHAIVTFGEPADPSKPVKGEGDNRGNTLTDQQLMTFVPGNEHYIYPQETGLRLTKGSSIFAQMHYTTNGKATSDTTKLGIYFRDDTPEHVLRHYAIINPEISIPPGDNEHWESAYFRFRDDAVIYSIFPHAHYRGASSKFKLKYPDGKEELILSVPNYDFNWQRYFQLEEPIHVPAGTFLVHDTAWDNSANNPYNPDPSKEIRWGLQSWEEMLYGGVSYRYKNIGIDTPENELIQYRADLAMGYMDSNQDGKLVMDELPEQMRKRLAVAFTWLDANQSGGLETDELKNFFKPRQRAASDSSGQ